LPRGPQFGVRMQDALNTIRANPGLSKYEIAKLMYGADTSSRKISSSNYLKSINLLIERGYVTAKKVRGKYKLYAKEESE
jgi:hypothetical protein